MQHRTRMQHRRSTFLALFGAVRFWCSCGVLAAAVSACGEENCDPQSGADCTFADVFDDTAKDEDAPSCASLGEAACRQSGRCFVDSVCKAPACSGVSCSDSCELVKTCRAY